MSIVTDLFKSDKPKVEPSVSPRVGDEAAAPSREALKRAGRASLLLSTSSQGVLGNAKTGRASILSA